MSPLNAEPTILGSAQEPAAKAAPLTLARREPIAFARDANPPIEQRTALLAALPFFEGMPEEAVTRLAESCRVVRVRRGDYTFRRGDPCTGFYVVVYGKIQLLLPDEDNGSKVMAVMERGMSFGAAAMFMKIPFPVSSRAVEDTMLIFLPREAIQPLLEEQPDFSQRLLRYMSGRLHQFVQDIAAYTQKGADSRVAGYLLELCEDSPGLNFRLPDSKRVIASRLSLAPETLSRTLRHLKESGLIRVSGYSVEVLDLSGLKRVASS